MEKSWDLAQEDHQRRPLTELYVKGCFAEDRSIWEKELQRHCDEVYVDVVETTEEQEKSILKYKEDGDRHFTEEGRVAGITVELVLQAGAKMTENKVNGLNDPIASDMIKQLPQELSDDILQDAFKIGLWRLVDASSSWRIVQLLFLWKPDAAPKKGEKVAWHLN